MAAETTKTHCPYCALNCGLSYSTADNGQIDQLVRWKGSPLTRGALCAKGSTAHEQVKHPERLLQPLIRRGADFEPASWDDALDRAAEGLLRIAAKHGPAANAVLSGGSLTNEKVYLVGKLARLGLGTPHVDYNGRFCMVAAGTAHKLAFGMDRMMTPLEDLDKAQLAVVVGANLSSAFPVAIPKALDRLRKRGGRVVVIDPRIGRFAKPTDTIVQLRPGSDAAFFGGVLRELHAGGWIDHDFVAQRTQGFDGAIDSVQRWTPNAVQDATGISPAVVAEVAQLIARADRAIYLHGRGPEQQETGTDNVLSLINVALAAGHVGRKGCGVNMLTGQRNGQGGREWGQRCNQLPAGRDIDDPAHRRVVALRWGVHQTVLPPSGATYTEILDLAGRGEIRGLLSICTNMSVSAPDLDRVASQMAALDHVVMIDPFFSASARHADVILPGSTFTEEEGTITTIEGRVVRIDAVTPPLALRADIDVIRNLAHRLGVGDKFDFARGREVFEEMRRVSAGGPIDYAGITWDRLRRADGVFWPCPDESHSGTPRLYLDRFGHADGKARFHPVVAPPTEQPSDPGLVLTTGRDANQFLSGNQTMRIPALRARAPGPYVEVHPDTAESHSLTPEVDVEITSSIASVRMPWRANPDLRHDTLYMPYHWPECNRLVEARLDPRSKIPAFKYTPVTIRSAEQPTPADLTMATLDVSVAQ